MDVPYKDLFHIISSLFSLQFSHLTHSVLVFSHLVSFLK